MVPNGPVPNCPGAKFSWCQIVQCQIIRGAKLYALVYRHQSIVGYGQISQKLGWMRWIPTELGWIPTYCLSIPTLSQLRGVVQFCLAGGCKLADPAWLWDSHFLRKETESGLVLTSEVSPSNLSSLKQNADILLARFDTHVFLLNEYFIELNAALFLLLRMLSCNWRNLKGKLTSAWKSTTTLSKVRKMPRRAEINGATSSSLMWSPRFANKYWRGRRD